MNIHEHQAKQILKKYGAVVPEGVFALTVDDLLEKVKSLKTLQVLIVLNRFSAVDHSSHQVSQIYTTDKELPIHGFS